MPAFKTSFTQEFVLLTSLEKAEVGAPEQHTCQATIWPITHSQFLPVGICAAYPG